LWQVGIGLGSQIFGNVLFLTGDNILWGIELRLGPSAVTQGEGGGAYQMETELERTKSGDEYQENEVECHITNTLPHTSRSHDELCTIE